MRTRIRRRNRPARQLSSWRHSSHAGRSLAPVMVEHRESTDSGYKAVGTVVAKAASMLWRVALEHRRFIVVTVHLALVLLSPVLAFWLRYDGDIPAGQMELLVGLLPVLLVVRGTTFALFGLYQGLWRFTGIWDLRDIVVAVLVSSALILVATWGLGVGGYPRSVALIDALLLTTLMVGIRLTRRVVSDTRSGKRGRTVLVVGAGDAGEMVVRDMKRRGDYLPIGFVDDDESKVGVSIHGVRVLGTRHELPLIMRTHRPDDVLVALPGAVSSALARELVTVLAPFTARITTLPSIHEIVSGKATASQIRQLSIEDLLFRSAVGLDKSAIKHFIKGQRVMVTGAGGSIGSELCRQIAGLRPSCLVLYERYENSLYSVEKDLTDGHPSMKIHACIGDITDVRRLDDVLTEHQPNIVFHAAAHKHVPLMEQNPCEAVKNNVRGTRLLAEATERHGVDRFIMISSDKAVNPSSVMGATKRVGELIVRSLSDSSPTSFSIVRFGNVLGSNGSVLLRFVDQLKAGGPLTVTHPEISRYFMLVSEAVELVLQAAAAGKPGATYVLEMGEQIKMIDFAKTLIRLSGYQPDEIPITFTGLRPGEKMHEELVGAGESSQPSGIENVMLVTTGPIATARALAQEVAMLERLADDNEVVGVLQQLRQIEPGFRSGGPAIAPEPSVQPFPHAILEASALTCPSCSLMTVHRSRTRTMSARVRRYFTSARPHRCHHCGWRSWIEPTDGPGSERPASFEPKSPDFRLLDQMVGSRSLSKDPLLSPRELRH